jgi:hypothetical protein
VSICAAAYVARIHDHELGDGQLREKIMPSWLLV